VKPTTITFIPWRFNIIIILILIIVLGLVVRLVELAVIKHHFLEMQGNARTLRMVVEPAFRGMITDRNGAPLAISTTVYSVWMNPKELTHDRTQLKKIQRLLVLKSLNCNKYKNADREFVYIKRDISPDQAAKIRALKVPGIYLQENYKRYYPESEVAAQVIGFTNVDDKGQEGLELAFNEWLSGTPGKEMVLKDRLGRIISNVQKIQEKKSGNDLTLSIDRHIQYLAYRELLSGVLLNEAESGSAVVLDIKTGEVLAMANFPSYNPNNRVGYRKELFRNRTVTDVFEPGSTMKAFSIASALDSKLYHPNSVVDTSPGWMRVGHDLVRDEHNNGVLSVAQILQLSSNVGATKIALSLPPTQLWNLLHRIGFGEITGIGFPGERSGELIPHAKWSPIELATLSYGYGLSITTLQLAEAYAILGNQGIKLPLSLVRLDEPPAGTAIIDKKVAEDMLTLLESVVSAKGGTGSFAQIPGYRVAGKTGTAWMHNKNGYEKHHYISSFVGLAPVSHPRFVVAVVIRDPKGKHFLAGYVSSPIFKKIMEETLHGMNIPPDQN